MSSQNPINPFSSATSSTSAPSLHPSDSKSGQMSGRKISFSPVPNLALNHLPILGSVSAPIAGNKKNPPIHISKTVNPEKSGRKTNHEYQLFETFVDFEKRWAVVDKVLNSFQRDAESTSTVDDGYEDTLRQRLKVNETQKKDKNENLRETRRLFKAIVEFLSREFKEDDDCLLPLDVQKHSSNNFEVQIQIVLSMIEHELSKVPKEQERSISRLGVSKELLQKRLSSDSSKSNVMAPRPKDEKEILILAKMLKFEEKEIESDLLKIKHNISLIHFEEELIKLTKGEMEARKLELEEQIKLINARAEEIVKGTVELPGKIKPRAIHDSVLQQSATKLLLGSAAERIKEGSGEIFKIGDKYIFKPIHGAPGMPGNSKKLSHTKDRGVQNRLGFPNGSGSVRDYATSLILGFGPRRCLTTLSLFSNNLKERGLLVQYVPNLMDLQELYNTIIAHYQRPTLEADLERASSSFLSASTEIKSKVEEIGLLVNSTLKQGIDQSSSELEKIIAVAFSLESSMKGKDVLSTKTREFFKKLTKQQSKEKKFNSYQRALVEACVAGLGANPGNIKLQDLVVWKQFTKKSIRKILIESFRIPIFDMNASNVLICRTNKDDEYDAVLIDREHAYPDTWQNIHPFFWLGTSIGSLRISELADEIAKMSPEKDIKTLSKNGISFDSESSVNDPDDPIKSLTVGCDASNIVKAFQLVAKKGLELDKKDNLKEHEQITANDVGAILCSNPTKKGIGKSLLQQLFLMSIQVSSDDYQQDIATWARFSKIVEEEFNSMIGKRAPKTAAASAATAD